MEDDFVYRGRKSFEVDASFGTALIGLKQGRRVTRKGWNGKGMWLGLMPGVLIPEGAVNERTKHFVPSGPLDCQPYIAMWTSEGKWQPGWTPSQADMLTNDWIILS